MVRFLETRRTWTASAGLLFDTIFRSVEFFFDCYAVFLYLNIHKNFLIGNISQSHSKASDEEKRSTLAVARPDIRDIRLTRVL